LSLAASTAFCFAGAFFLDAAGVPLDFAARAKGLDTTGLATGLGAGFLMRLVGVGLGIGAGVASFVASGSPTSVVSGAVDLRLDLVRFGADLTGGWTSVGSGVGSTVAVLDLVLLSRTGNEPSSLISRAPRGLVPVSLFLFVGDGASESLVSFVSAVTVSVSCVVDTGAVVEVTGCGGTGVGSTSES